MLKRSILALLSTFALSQYAHSEEITGFVAFGDSLSDSGTFGARFTTNPGLAWTDNLANRYGITIGPNVLRNPVGGALISTPGGSNYAQGGALVATDTATALAISNQVTTFLGNSGGSANANNLYTVWGGANDLLAALAVPATAVATLNTASTNLATSIATLQGAGAKYIVVPSLPNMGLTPQAIGAGAAAQAQITQLSGLYNELLFAKLDAANVKVIPIDTFSLLNEIVAQPARYGITNTTGVACAVPSSLACTSATLTTPGADQTFIFADAIHPTTAAHQVLSDYTYSVLQAPQFARRLSTLSAFAQRDALQEVARQSAGSFANGDPVQVWVNASAGDVESTENNDGLEGGPLTVSLGINQLLNDNTTIGLSIHLHSDSSEDEVETEQRSLSLYLAKDWGDLTLNTALNFSSGDFDTSRQATLGTYTRTMTGETNSDAVAAELNLRYHMNAGKLTHGPLAGLRVQRVLVEGFRETTTEGDSTALVFQDQTEHYSTAILGWHAAWDSKTFKPYASIQFESLLSEEEREVEAALSTIEANVFSAPLPEADDQYGNAEIGVQAGLFDNLNVGASVNHIFDNDDIEETRFTLKAVVAL